MTATQLSSISILEIDESTPFIVRGFTADGLPIIQLIKHPVGYTKTEHLILIEVPLKKIPNQKGKKYLRIEKTITTVTVKIKGSDMEIILPDIKRRKLDG